MKSEVANPGGQAEIQRQQAFETRLREVRDTFRDKINDVQEQHREHTAEQKQQLKQFKGEIASIAGLANETQQSHHSLEGRFAALADWIGVDIEQKGKGKGKDKGKGKK